MGLVKKVLAFGIRVYPQPPVNPGAYAQTFLWNVAVNLSVRMKTPELRWKTTFAGSSKAGQLYNTLAEEAMSLQYF